ncbi:MAG TPA: AI-2E family transporter [Jiangellaceae bacterium]|nr:AI-2E family transporter [Jiangellaceae bacterium]
MNAPETAVSGSQPQEAAQPVPAFAGTPRWLRVAGLTGWLALGVTGATAVILWASSYISNLVTPFLFAVVLAILFTPLVDWLTRRGMPRFVAAVLVLLALVVVAVASTLVVVRGIAQEAPEIGDVISSAADEVESWLTSAGISAPTASDMTSSAVNAGKSATLNLVSGIFSGLGALSSILFMVFIGSVILLFMLLHGSRYRTWFVAHSGLSTHTIEPVVDDAASAIRGYFKGTTLLAVTNAVPVGLAAWLLGVPLVGAIALVTFITAYVPFFGAIIAGVFACLIALGSQGLTTALIMLAVLLLVNNVLQNFFAPVAYGSSLRLDPLVVLLVTTGAGLIGGVALIVLAAPLTAIISRAAGRLAAARRATSTPTPHDQLDSSGDDAPASHQS